MSTRIADPEALIAPYRKALAQAIVQAAIDTTPPEAAVQSPATSQAGAAAPSTGARRVRSTPRPAAEVL